MIGAAQASDWTYTCPLKVGHTCSQTTCLALGSPKTNLVFTPNSIFHILSDLFDHHNQPSHH